MTQLAGTDELFGAALRRLRLAAGLSQEALAERARLSAESISALERGARLAPYRTTIDLLADGLALDSATRSALAELGVRARARGPRGRGTAGAPDLPAYATRSIDRERERSELTDLVKRERVITVCGPGGVGKTRLAVEVAAAAGGIARFVDLAALREPAHVVPRISTALGLHAFVAERGAASLVELLRRSNYLLVLDNCEHLIDACAHTVEVLVRGCPQIRILATSREPLLVDGETIYRLNPFADAQPAIELFTDRARAAAPDFSLDSARDIVEGIARRLDCMPLAIELAAALARTQSAAEISRTLAGATFLSGAVRRTANEHQRTMEATLAWSYALLQPAERNVLRLLAYPVAGMTLDAATEIGGPLAAAGVRRLIDASLVSEVAGRLRLHAMTRQYVVSITAPAERDDLARRYAARLGVHMRVAFDRGWRTMSYAVYEPLAAELDNVRQALVEAVNRGDREAALAVAGAPDYWTAIGRTPEGFSTLTRIDRAFHFAGDDPRDAIVIFGIALCAAQSGLVDQTAEPAGRAAAIARRYGITVIEGRCSIARGTALIAAGDAAAAAEMHAGAIALFAATGDATGIARASSFRALALVECGGLDAASAALADAARIHAEMPAPVGAADELVIEVLLSDIARLRGDIETSLDRAREAVSLLGSGHRTSAHVRAVHHYVDACISAGETAAALDVALPELDFLHERGFLTEVALLAERLALLLVRAGHTRLAAAAAAFADRELAAAGRRRMLFDRRAREILERELARAAPSWPDEPAAAGDPAEFVASIREALERVRSTLG